ncbi:MAG TPA: N-acetylmuramoyl-L-alanine amidase [Chthoniobacterales bacterium]
MAQLTVETAFQPAFAVPSGPWLGLLVIKLFQRGRIFLGLSVLGLAACAQTGPAASRLSPGTFRTVVIDAGHGGKDNGGLSSRRMPYRLREKDLTLDTALRVRKNLRRAGFRTVLTRDNDTFVELDDRVAMADRQGTGAILVSIHYNATGNESANGPETYFWRADSHGLATRIERRMAAIGGLRPGGVIRRRLRLTRNPEIPAVLCECAYLTNAADNRHAADPAFRQKVANAIAEGVVEESRSGDEGIAAVPELYAPLSHASDRVVARSHPRKHHRVRRIG